MVFRRMFESDYIVLTKVRLSDIPSRGISCDNSARNELLCEGTNEILDDNGTSICSNSSATMEKINRSTVII